MGIPALLLGFFYRFVAASMTTNFANPDAGLLIPYSAMFAFFIVGLGLIVIARLN